VLIELDANHRRRFRMTNTLQEYERLVSYLRQFDGPALVGFEATGNYHHPLAYFLHAVEGLLAHSHRPAHRSHRRSGLRLPQRVCDLLLGGT
jgi:transposase